MKLREIRWGLGGLSQDALIERLGLTDYINRGEISDFERGVREPDLLTLKAYADAAGVLVDDLIDDDVRLPEELPAAKHIKGATQKGRMIAVMNTITVTLWLRIENKDHLTREENRARRNIEKACLKQYGMNKLNDHEYELTFSHQDDEDLDEQIYALLGAIKSDAKRRNCSIKVNVREKGADRYW